MCLTSQLAAETVLHRAMKHGVELTISLDRSDAVPVLQARFKPVALGSGWHLYGTDLPEKGIELMPGTFLGRPTRIGFPADSAIQPAGAMSHDPAMELVFSDAMQRKVNFFPEGTVTLRYPVSVPSAGGSATLQVWYMLCTENTCNPPVDGEVISVTVPASP
jgi:hypothetical protein